MSEELHPAVAAMVAAQRAERIDDLDPATGFPLTGPDLSVYEIMRETPASEAWGFLWDIAHFVPAEIEDNDPGLAAAWQGLLDCLYEIEGVIGYVATKLKRAMPVIRVNTSAVTKTLLIALRFMKSATTSTERLRAANIGATTVLLAVETLQACAEEASKSEVSEESEVDWRSFIFYSLYVTDRHLQSARDACAKIIDYCERMAPCIEERSIEVAEEMKDAQRQIEDMVQARSAREEVNRHFSEGEEFTLQDMANYGGKELHAARRAADYWKKRGAGPVNPGKKPLRWNAAIARRIAVKMMEAKPRGGPPKKN